MLKIFIIEIVQMMGELHIMKLLYAKFWTSMYDIVTDLRKLKWGLMIASEHVHTWLAVILIVICMSLNETAVPFKSLIMSFQSLNINIT